MNVVKRRIYVLLVCASFLILFIFFAGERFSAVWGLEIFEIVAISFLPRRTRWQNFWPTGTHSMQEARLNRISVYRRSIFAYRTAHVARVIHDMSRAFCQKRKKMRIHGASRLLLLTGQQSFSRQKGDIISQYIYRD
jgi:hypothetical protein